jgi:hypothetical protein
LLRLRSGGKDFIGRISVRPHLKVIVGGKDKAGP